MSFTPKAKYIGKHLLTDEFVKEPHKIGDYLERLFVTMYKMELYDAEGQVYSYRVQMPPDWHLLYREIYPYLQIVKKSRKKPRKSRSNRNDISP